MKVEEKSDLSNAIKKLEELKDDEQFEITLSFKHINSAPRKLLIMKLTEFLNEINWGTD